MKAVVMRGFGDPEVLKYEEIATVDGLTVPTKSSIYGKDPLVLGVLP